jgi:tetratricopeptide (TPR) repeat protein
MFGGRVQNSMISTGFRLAGTLWLAAALSGCAAKYDTLTPDVQAKMMEDLKLGRPVLDCGEKCLFTWISRVNTIHQYDTAERWPELAQTVMQVGYGQDLAYYYLGQAAQGLGYHEAAIAYYNLAYSINTGADHSLQCATIAAQIQTPCEGVDLASSIPVLVKASQDAIAQEEAATRAAENQPPPPPKHHYHPRKPAASSTASSGGSTSAASSGSGSSGSGTPAGWSLPPPSTGSAPAGTQ